MNSLIIQIVFGVLCALNYATATGVSRCWSCSDATCNDPFNSRNANIMNCTNINSYRSVAVNEWGEGIDVLFDKYNSLYRADTEYVCVKYVVNSTIQSNYVFTMRLCSPKIINGQDTCTAIRQTVGSTIGPVTTCQTCDSNFCNSATRWSFSILALLVFGSLEYFLR